MTKDELGTRPLRPGTRSDLRRRLLYTLGARIRLICPCLVTGAVFGTVVSLSGEKFLVAWDNISRFTWHDLPTYEVVGYRPRVCKGCIFRGGRFHRGAGTGKPEGSPTYHASFTEALDNSDAAKALEQYFEVLRPDGGSQ